eukprot:2719509-Prymnesium_polylepis.1
MFRVAVASSFIIIIEVVNGVFGGVHLPLLRSSVVCQAQPETAHALGLAQASEFSGSLACADKAAVLRVAQRMEGQLASTSMFVGMFATPLLAVIADTRSRTAVLAISASSKLAKMVLVVACSLAMPTEHSLSGPAHSTIPRPLMFLAAVLDGTGFNGPLNALAGDFTPPEMRGKVFTVFTIAHAAGSVGSALINAIVLHLDLTSY